MGGMIHTVLGPVPAEKLGVTYDHEHLLFRPPAPFAEKDADLALTSVEAAIVEVGRFKSAGGSAIIEMTTAEMGRNPRGLKRIAQASGIHIVAATGFNKDQFCAPFVAGQSAQQIAARMIADLTSGMDDTDIPAGLVKFSTSKDRVTETEERIIAAALMAHQATGAPVSTHTEAGTLGLEQVQRVLAAGVAAERVIIGHLDRKLEWDYLLEVAKTGVFLGFDQISKEKYFPDAQRIEIIQQLVEHGYGRQILLSGDLARQSNWPAYGFGKGPGLTYILWRFVPWMLENGIALQAVEDMLIHNPARAFAWQ